MTVNNLPAVDRFQGVTYQESMSADPKAATVELQYSDRARRPHALKMPVADAMHLLSMLEQLVKDEALEHLRQGD
jgi:hypothetical protein